MRKKIFWRVLILSNILLIILFAVSSFQRTSNIHTTPYSIYASLPTIVNSLRPGVVALFSQKDNFYLREKQDGNQQVVTQNNQLHVGGTAFFIDTQGYLLTSKHIVENKDDYIAVLDDGSSFKIDNTWLHPVLDLAIIRLENTVNRRFFVPAIIENMNPVGIGTNIFVLGTPFSQYINTLSVGILSATGRTLNVEGRKPYSGLYQLDMNINPGNSGSPVFDYTGKIFGIVTAISSQSSHIGFALPISQKLISNLLIDIKQKDSIQTHILQ